MGQQHRKCLLFWGWRRALVDDFLVIVVISESDIQGVGTFVIRAWFHFLLCHDLSTRLSNRNVQKVTLREGNRPARRYSRTTTWPPLSTFYVETYISLSVVHIILEAHDAHLPRWCCDLFCIITVVVVLGEVFFFFGFFLLQGGITDQRTPHSIWVDLV